MKTYNDALKKAAIALDVAVKLLRKQKFGDSEVNAYYYFACAERVNEINLFRKGERS